MGNSGANGAVIFNQAASGKAVTMGANSRINQAYGLFDPVSPANLPVTIGYRQDVGGTIVLSTNFTWANLVSGRTWKNTSTPVGGEWNGRSFAARGAAQVIDGTGAFESGTTNTWLGISPILMGSTVTNADGTFYANAGVKIARDIIISNDYSVTVASTGPGITNPSTAGFVFELASTISGTGSFRTVAAGTGHQGQLPELVLSGTSVWSGVHNFDYQNGGHYMVGPGGMAIGGSYQLVGFVRFNGNASIPSGNGGSNCYVLAMGRSSSDGKFGYLLTGSDANPVYTLTNGVRFMLGGGSAPATLGLAIGQATLRDSMVSINNETGVANTNQDLYLFVRDTNSTFTLGAPGQAVRFSSCALTLNAISQGWYSPTNQAAAMNERIGINTLRKRGPGTLLLSNVQYTLIDGTGDNATNFVWQIGSGVLNIGNPFDGVVKESGTSVSNSLRTMRSVILNGGVMGLTSDFSPVLGTNAANNNIFFSMAGAAGGGFAAYGGRRTVTINPRGGYNYFGWPNSTATDGRFFLASGAPLILNAPDADGAIVLTSDSTNSINLTTLSEIRVFDNVATNTDEAILNIKISSNGSLVKTGAGTLTLTATNNDYTGYTYVSNGTLNVNGAILGSASNIYVYSGATLGGTGTIARAVNIVGTGALTAGATNRVGTLTISSNLVFSGSGSLVVDVSASGVDKVIVNGTGTVNLNGLSLVVVPAAGFEMTGGQDLTIMTTPNGLITGSFTTVPKGYTVRIDNGKTLVLHRDSPGFIFRIQ